VAFFPGTPQNDTIIGNDNENDRLVGLAGDDFLDGRSGADQMEGGLGNDTFVVDDENDLVIELAGEGTDSVNTSRSSYTLGANLEFLIYFGTAAFTGTGNSLDNFIQGRAAADVLFGLDGEDSLFGLEGDDRLEGGTGNDFLVGGTGADLMIGGLGSDIYFVDETGDVVLENQGEGEADEVRSSLSFYQLAANVEKLIYTGSSASTLRGNSGSNEITGGAAGDLLLLQDGGVDVALGGGGSDQFYYGAAFTSADSNDGGLDTDVVVLQGNYTLLTGVSSFLNVEFLSLQSGTSTRYGEAGTASYDYDLTFVDANVAAGQRFTVNASQLVSGEEFAFNGAAETDGQFLVYAGFGNDNLIGGAGNDLFHFEGTRWGSGDFVDGGAGADALIIRGNGGLLTIAFGELQVRNIESITVSDRFGLGAAGRPSYDLTLANGNVTPGGLLILNGSTLLDPSQIFNVDGSAVTGGNLRLFGGAGGDRMIGGAGSDLFYAAGGQDTLTGGGGADTFQVRATSDSMTSARDRILDFASGIDKLDLRFIDADVNVGGDQAFTFVGAAAFTQRAGELRAFDTGLGFWRVEGDVNGDGAADFALDVTLATANPLVNSDFIL
jgi:Ca2+-binding RTX toxin-like protein